MEVERPELDWLRREGVLERVDGSMEGDGKGF
jgi:hypothetical protein